MKLLYLQSIIFFFFLNSINAQDFESGKVWVLINDPNSFPQENGNTNNPDFNQVLNEFDVTVSRPFDFAKTETLQRVYELKTLLDEDSLSTALEAINGEQVFSSIEKIPLFTPLSNPSDFMWQLMLDNDTANDWLWYLKKIKADKAWDITKGNPNINVYHGESADLSHPDLITELSSVIDFYDNDSLYLGPKPDASFFGSVSHGTAVATLFAGETADSGQAANGQMASVGYNTKLLYSNWVGGPVLLKASTVENVKIINISYYIKGVFGRSPIWRDIENEVLSNGTIVVRGAGNGYDMDSAHAHKPLYPFSGVEDERVIVVSSTNQNDQFLDQSGDHISPHSHYSQVDLCAPGYDIMGGTVTLDGSGNPSQWPYYGGWTGSSHATPQVSGTAALMLSVNPCLASSSAQDILKSTTDPIVDAVSYPGEVGTGRVNAYRAVKVAQDYQSSDLDLYIKDRQEDLGYPGSYVFDWYFDNSPDIWVRQQQDGFINQEHEDPLFSSTTPIAYVYVRVRNKSCVDAPSNTPLRLYWTHASSNSSWPNNWTNGVIGDTIGTFNIGSLPSGQDTILVFPWELPAVTANQGTCLLARIESPIDEITVYPQNLSADVYHNNNIAMKNLTVIKGKWKVFNGYDVPPGNAMLIGNPIEGDDENYIIEFKQSEGFTSNLLEEAEVNVYVTQEFWDIANNSPDLQINGLEIISDNLLRITGENALLSGLLFPPNTRIPIYVSFNFYGENAEENEKRFMYHVIQYREGGEYSAGGVHFVVVKNPREVFEADAGDDQVIFKGDIASISAKSIKEPAKYNWYDANDSLLYSGSNLLVDPQSETKYKLEVIADVDGFKDYDEVLVEVKLNWIKDISPNPTTDLAEITYHLDSVASANLIVKNILSTVSNNYVLNTASDRISIDFGNYPNGVYQMILMVEGVALDSRMFVKQ